MKSVNSIALAAGVFAALFATASSGATASPLLNLTNQSAAVAEPAREHVIKIQKTTRDNGVPYWSNRAYQPGHNPYRNHGVYLDRRSPGYYTRHNPYYDEPYPHQYYNNDPDPYYDRPRSGRYSCGEIVRMLCNRGYRNIQPYDCKGKVYSFFAYSGHQRYKLRVRSKNGSIKTRKRL